MGEKTESNNFISWESDQLGTCAHFLIDESVYSRIAIFKTAYWHTDQYYLFLNRSLENPHCIKVEIRPKKEMDRAELDLSCKAFCNSLIDQQVRQDVIKETGNIRDALVEKAFRDGKKHLNPDDLLSDESFIPNNTDDYKNDLLNIGKITGA